MTQSNAFVLKSIEVKNWKTFTEATLNVENHGLTGIVGQNGSGKSSFVDAILWCLYGHRPKDVNQASLRRRKSDPSKDDTFVRVTFTHAGQTVEVFRAMKGKRHNVTAGIFLDGKEITIATGGTAETWITKRLGMDAEGFRTAVVVPQKELDVLVDARPAPRREHIEKLAGIEELNLAVKQAREQENTLSKQVKVLAGSAEDVEQAETVLEELVDETEGNERNLERAVAEVADAQKKMDVVNEQSSSARDTLKEAISIDNEITSLKHNVDLSKSQVAELGTQISAIEKDVEGIDISQRAELESQYKTVNGEFNQINNDLAVHQSGLRNAQENVARIESNINNKKSNIDFESKQISEITKFLESHATIEELETEANECRTLVSDARGLVSSRTNLVADLKESIRLISSHEHEGATCPTCHTELKEPQKLVEQFKENIENAQREIAKANISEREAMDRLEKVIHMLNEVTSMRHTLSSRTEARQKMEEALEAEKALLTDAEQTLKGFSAFDVEKARADVAGLDKRKREIISEGEKIGAAEKALARKEELIQRRDTLKSSMIPNLEKIDSLKDQLDKYGDLAFLEMEVNNFDSAIASLRSDYSRLYTQMKDLETLKASLTERVNAAKANLAREENLASAKKTALAKLEEKSAVSDLLDEYRKERIARIAPELSATATDLISQMTNGRFIEVVVKDDFATGVIKSDGMEYAVAELSGGEKSVVALALRIAIGSLITGENAGLLWLDEVLPAQDKERRDAILNVLRSLPIQQIVMINHTHEAEDVVDRVVKISYDGEGSTIEE